MTTIFGITDNIGGRKRKVEAWKNRILEDCFGMFPNLTATINNEKEELDIMSLRNVIGKHVFFDSVF